MADELEQEEPLSPEMEAVYRDALTNRNPPDAPKRPVFKLCSNCTRPDSPISLELPDLPLVGKAARIFFCSLRCLAIWALTKGWAK